MAHPHLTPREIETLYLLADGLTNKEVADALKPRCSPRTVAYFISCILRKLEENTRTGAVITALHQGWLPKLERKLAVCPWCHSSKATAGTSCASHRARVSFTGVSADYSCVDDPDAKP